MTDEQTGLPADFVHARRHAQHRRPRRPTSARTCGAPSSAERLGIIGHRETVARLGRTLTTLERMERGDGRPVLQLVRHPHRRDLADHAGRRPGHAVAVLGRQRLARGRPADRREPRAGAARAGAGAVRLDGLRLLLPAPSATRSSSTTRPTTGDAPCCYDTIVSESRIASYVGIEKGELPPRQYYGAFRAFHDNCDIETKPVGVTRCYLGESRVRGRASRTRARG